MKLIDLHCDTIDKLMDYPNENLYKNNFSVDINKLQKTNSLAQIFAIYFDLDRYKSNPYNRFENMYDRFFEEIKKYGNNISIARNYKEIIENEKLNKISAILSIEEGGALNGDLQNLYKVYEKGVRLITLTWNYENEIGSPHTLSEYKDSGLKPFGTNVVEAMNELGMLIDVSHLNDAGFYDVANISKKPFVASHSNSRSITNVSRNLTDDMIKVLGNNGGVTGMNFCSYFLGDSKIARVDDIIHHIKHIVNIGGIDVVAMGTDFDGIGNEVEVKDISQMNKLQDALLRSGFTENDVEKMMYKNALRVIKEVL